MAERSDGISVSGLLLVAFIVLKLCSVIGWSWWWVLSPLWIPLALFLLFALFAFVIVLLNKLYELSKTKQKDIR